MVMLIAIGCGLLVVLLAARAALSDPVDTGLTLPPGDITLEATAAVRPSRAAPPLELVGGPPALGDPVVHGTQLPIPEVPLSLLGISEDPHADDQIYTRVREKLGKS